MKKSIIVTTVSLFLICLCATVLLGIVNGITEDKIAENAVKTEQESQKVVMADAASFGEKKEDTYSFEGADTKYSVTPALDKDGKTIGYVFVTESTGYGGAISIMTGVKADGTVAGVEFLEINETVGLGMNARKDTFKDQFKGLVNGIAVNKNEAAGNEIKALTGATITSKAVTKGINIALDIFENNFAGGENNG